MWRRVHRSPPPPPPSPLALAEGVGELPAAPAGLDALREALSRSSPESIAVSQARLFGRNVQVAPYEGSYEDDPFRQARRQGGQPRRVATAAHGVGEDNFVHILRTQSRIRQTGADHGCCHLMHQQPPKRAVDRHHSRAAGSHDPCHRTSLSKRCRSGLPEGSKAKSSRQISVLGDLSGPNSVRKA